MRDPKSTSTIRKLPHCACTLDNVSVGVKSLFVQLHYQQVALEFKEEFHTRNGLWRKAYIPDLFFFSPDMLTRMKAMQTGVKEKKIPLFKALNVDY